MHLLGFCSETAIRGFMRLSTIHFPFLFLEVSYLVNARRLEKKLLSLLIDSSTTKRNA
jgi:hypothetical protein